MPIRRRRTLLQNSSPYSVPCGKVGPSRSATRGYRRLHRQRHSSWTIEEDRVKEFIPTSMSENGPHGLATERSCMSLCGIFDADSDVSSPGYQNSVKEALAEQKTPEYNGFRHLSQRSRCYSMPVDVPLRKNVTKTRRKSSKKSRSSGGYFFDKYIKRFRNRRTQSIGSDGSESPDSSNEYSAGVEMQNPAYFPNSPTKKFQNNRQDMIVVGSGAKVEYFLIGEDYDDALIADDESDDLYPRRYGSSSDWSACSVNPTVSALKPKGLDFVPYSPQILPTYYTPITPSSPPPGTVLSPLTWDDPTVSVQDAKAANTPVSNLLSDYYEANYRYDDDTLKALESLYWCNFRVTAEGDWLCLKELEGTADGPANEEEGQNQGFNEDTTPSPLNAANVEQLRIERKNLLGMAKLSIKGLIESSLSAGHTLDSDHVPLQQFFVIMEAVLRHGLKSPKLFFAGNKSFWGPLEAIEKIGSEAAEITNSVRELPGLKSHVGRARAWLRLALMQKRLADYFRMIVEHRDIMKEFYETEALVLSEEGVVLSGHLVGLNCIDANLCMKGDDLDNQNPVIDYSLYIKDGNRSISSELNLVAEGEEEEEQKSEKSETVEEKMRDLANQKNYLEERNRYLETTLSELQKRAGHTSSSNQLLEAELEAAKISVASLKEERERLLKEKEEMGESHKKTLTARQADLDAERDTLIQSRAGLDEQLSQAKKQLKQEAIMRMDVERELEVQISLKQEMEVAMKLLEKDIYDKQDSLVSLREQLNNVKGINIDIYKKLQDKTESVEAKGNAMKDLEQETKRLNTEVAKLKEKVGNTNRQLDIALQRADGFAQNLDDSEKLRNALETNLKIEREWRMALEQNEEKSTNQIAQLQTELSMMQLLKQELEGVKNERDELKATCDEQESTINDLADHLGKSKQNFQDLKDVHRSITDKTWEKDKEVKICTQCEKPFNLSRRKHHCRNCGQIYCNTCSDNTMPLASSAKPVRVCDACHTLLLQRYNATTP